MKYVDVEKVIKSPSALTQEQGNLIYNEICDAFDNYEEIELDFENVESMISPFLNNSIGKLYGKYDSDQIRKFLHMKNFPAEKNSTLNVVIGNAKRFYADKSNYTKVVKEVIDNE